LRDYYIKTAERQASRDVSLDVPKAKARFDPQRAQSVQRIYALIIESLGATEIFLELSSVDSSTQEKRNAEFL
jgi:hypothetical protein